jgi:pimeloyl-ACP methyl ester carboxylesterase
MFSCDITLIISRRQECRLPGKAELIGRHHAWMEALVASPPMATCAVGGREIGYERCGAGPPIVVLNGFAGTRADWDPGFIAGLAAEHELVLLDNRGVGESSVDEQEFTVEDLAGDTIAVIESLELERPCLLGWSMGGFVTMAVALERPDLAASLVLLSTHSGPGAIPIPEDVGATLRDLSGPPAEQAARVVSVLFTPERAPQVAAAAGEFIAAARARLEPGVVERQWRAMEAWHENGATARLDEIGCQALVATGAEDIVCPPKNATALAAGLGDAWLARFPRSAHAFMADHPVAVSGLVTAFLAAQR